MTEEKNKYIKHILNEKQYKIGFRGVTESLILFQGEKYATVPINMADNILEMLNSAYINGSLDAISKEL